MRNSARLRSFIIAASAGVLGIGLTSGTHCPLLPVPMPDGPAIGLTLVAEGLASPVGMDQPDDATGRLFIADQIGQVRVIDASGLLLAAPFLDISDRMVDLMGSFDERGLLDVAFHPDYANNGRFFVCYNAPLKPEDSTAFNCRWRLSEFSVSPDDPDLADPGSELILIEILKPQFNHNGGEIAFDDDHLLYVSIGDGGGRDDVGSGHTPGLGNAQDISNLLGTIQRYDVSTPGALNIPGDNPFVGAGPLDAIYAFGLRNPWRFSFDMNDDSRLFCADAGQDLFEEVSLVPPGGNMGWNIREGSACFDPDNPETPPAACADTGAGGEPLIDPVLEYSHDSGPGGRLVVVGGYVYRGADIPGLDGRYVFGDWSSSFAMPDGSVLIAEEHDQGGWDFVEAVIEGQPGGRINRYVLAFGQNLEGEVFVLTSQSSGPTGTTGEVWRLTSFAE